MIDELDALARM